ncbi:MAG: phosphoadenylyl-sulfate reductase [Burkholderiaceae bacterium]
MHQQELESALRSISTRYPRAALASSLSIEDMVITDAIARLHLPIAVFTLDTGRLHKETLGLIDRVQEQYGLTIKVFHPVAEQVLHYVSKHGTNAFYESVELRKLCCGIRKVEPLSRALKDRDAWITGQRRAQSVTRDALALQEHDADRGIAKFNPLAAWTDAQVADYVKQHNVPVNPLHARGYPSIGCEPCTRAIKPGEDPRAGRWWWENADSKECGLHLSAAE